MKFLGVPVVVVQLGLIVAPLCETPSGRAYTLAVELRAACNERESRVFYTGVGRL